MFIFIALGSTALYKNVTKATKMYIIPDFLRDSVIANEKPDNISTNSAL